MLGTNREAYKNQIRDQQVATEQEIDHFNQTFRSDTAKFNAQLQSLINQSDFSHVDVRHHIARLAALHQRVGSVLEKQIQKGNTNPAIQDALQNNLKNRPIVASLLATSWSNDTQDKQKLIRALELNVPQTNLPGSGTVDGDAIDVGSGTGSGVTGSGVTGTGGRGVTGTGDRGGGRGTGGRGNHGADGRGNRGAGGRGGRGGRGGTSNPPQVYFDVDEKDISLLLSFRAYFVQELLSWSRTIHVQFEKIHILEDQHHINNLLYDLGSADVNLQHKLVEIETQTQTLATSINERNKVQLNRNRASTNEYIIQFLSRESTPNHVQTNDSIDTIMSRLEKTNDNYNDIKEAMETILKDETFSHEKYTQVLNLRYSLRQLFFDITFDTTELSQLCKQRNHQDILPSEMHDEDLTYIEMEINMQKSQVEVWQTMVFEHANERDVDAARHKLSLATTARDLAHRNISTQNNRAPIQYVPDVITSNDFSDTLQTLLRNAQHRLDAFSLELSQFRHVKNSGHEPWIARWKDIWRIHGKMLFTIASSVEPVFKTWIQIRSVINKSPNALCNRTLVSKTTAWYECLVQECKDVMCVLNVVPSCSDECEHVLETCTNASECNQQLLPIRQANDTRILFGSMVPFMLRIFTKDDILAYRTSNFIVDMFEAYRQENIGNFVLLMKFVHTVLESDKTPEKLTQLLISAIEITISDYVAMVRACCASAECQRAIEYTEPSF